jgi:hypothetical protein
MPRKAPHIEIPESDRITLLKRSTSRTLPKQDVDRALMILACADCKEIRQIAKDLNTYPNKVTLWRQRYVAKGLQGLQEAPRVERPVRYGKGLRDSVWSLLSGEPPKGLSVWDGPALAEALGADGGGVARVTQRRNPFTASTFRVGQHGPPVCRQSG